MQMIKLPNEPVLFETMETTGLMYSTVKKIQLNNRNILGRICAISVTRVKCGIRSTLCWKIRNISHSTELFGL